MRRHLLATQLLASTCAQAHQAWLENADGQAGLHFGGFNDKRRESSPGALDKFASMPAHCRGRPPATEDIPAPNQPVNP